MPDNRNLYSGRPAFRVLIRSGGEVSPSAIEHPPNLMMFASELAIRREQGEDIVGAVCETDGTIYRLAENGDLVADPALLK